MDQDGTAAARPGCGLNQTLCPSQEAGVLALAGHVNLEPGDISEAVRTRQYGEQRLRTCGHRKSVAHIYTGPATTTSEGCTGSSMEQMWLSVGILVMPNRL